MAGDNLWCRKAEGMAAIVFWILWLPLTAYLYEQWQRYEPTKIAIDGAAALAALPLALVASIAVL